MLEMSFAQKKLSRVVNNPHWSPPSTPMYVSCFVSQCTKFAAVEFGLKSFRGKAISHHSIIT